MKYCFAFRLTHSEFRWVNFLSTIPTYENITHTSAHVKTTWNCSRKINSILAFEKIGKFSTKLDGVFFFSFPTKRKEIRHRTEILQFTTQNSTVFKIHAWQIFQTVDPFTKMSKPTFFLPEKNLLKIASIRNKSNIKTEKCSEFTDWVFDRILKWK